MIILYIFIIQVSLMWGLMQAGIIEEFVNDVAYTALDSEEEVNKVLTPQQELPEAVMKEKASTVFCIIIV